MSLVLVCAVFLLASFGSGDERIELVETGNRALLTCRGLPVRQPAVLLLN